MRSPVGPVAVLIDLGLTGGGRAADPPARNMAPVDLTGRAEAFHFTRNWRAYYWREDFSFLLKEEKTGATWRVISREPTPAYDWRMGTTFPPLKVDWSAKPRVRVIGVAGVDRIPADFYDFKLDEPPVATAFVEMVETAPGRWQEYFVNNWFHAWGKDADAVVYRCYADKGPPYDVYGFIKGQSAPFSKKAQALIEQHPKARMFHGLVRTTKDHPFGYEVELLHLVGPDAQGRGFVYYGEPGKIPLLDKNKPQP